MKYRLTVFYYNGKERTFKGVERFKITGTIISLTSAERPGMWTYINLERIDYFEIDPE